VTTKKLSEKGKDKRAGVQAQGGKGEKKKGGRGVQGSLANQ